MSRKQVFTITFLALFLFLLYELIQIFTPFVMPVLWAVILGRLAHPLYREVRAGLRGRETLAAALVTIVVFALAVVPAVYVVVLLVQESVAAYEAVQAWLNEDGLARLAESISHLPLVGRYSQEWIGRGVVHLHKDLESSILQGGRALSGFLLAQATDVAKNAVAVITDFLVMLFTLFFLFRDGDRVATRLYRAVPLEPAHKAKLLQRLNTTISAVVRGTLLTALAQGTAAGLTYWLLDVPFPVFLGALSALLSLLPFGGTFLVWGPVSAYLFVTAPMWKAAVMLAVGGLLVGLMDNVLQPLLVGTGARLPLLLLFFASIGGLAYFGFIGLFLGPILLAIALTAFQIYEEDYQEPATRDETRPEPVSRPPRRAAADRSRVGRAR
ncbi:AI-2E family transporter [Candidatus Nitrospira bockiana]